jgi:exosortase A
MTQTSRIISVLLIIPLFFHNSMLAMVDVWIVNETFTHGFLIFPITIWLLWQKRSQLNRIQAASDRRALFLIIPLLTVWLVGYIGDVNSVHQLAVIALIPSTVLFLFGWKLFVASSFPLLYLFFAVPLGQGLIPSLMEFTAHFTVNMIQLTGIPVYQDGLYFILPSGNWSVVEECSGVRYLIASMALGTLYAYLNYQSVKKRTIFILFSIFVPILANGLRAYMIVMIGHLSGMKYAVGADHLLYGWVFFGLVIFIMFYIGSFWSEPESENANSSAEDRAKAGYSSLPLGLLLVIIALFIGTKTYAYHLNSPAPVRELALDSITQSLSGWSLNPNPGFDWTPEFNNPDSHLQSALMRDDEQIRFDVAFFAYQRDEAEAVSSLNRLTNPYEGEWKIIATAKIHHDGMDITQTELLKKDKKILVWSWYRVGTAETANPYLAKVYQVYNQLILGRKDASMVAISTPWDQNIEISSARIRDFLEPFKPALNQVLENAVSNPLVDPGH